MAPHGEPYDIDEVFITFPCLYLFADGADTARQYASKYASKPEKSYFLEGERSGVKEFFSPPVSKEYEEVIVRNTGFKARLGKRLEKIKNEGMSKMM